MLPAAVGALFYYIGSLMEHAERNWFIGVRTGWTLSSDKIWKKTDRLGGKVFKAAGVVAALGTFFPGFEFIFILEPALLTGGSWLFTHISNTKKN